uniref:uncharacterized protein LOC143386551 n=1 Tax=Callospermophilus lateralis TaxID=76772 RepID=UPI004038BC52
MARGIPTHWRTVALHPLAPQDNSPQAPAAFRCRDAVKARDSGGDSHGSSSRPSAPLAALEAGWRGEARPPVVAPRGEKFVGALRDPARPDPRSLCRAWSRPGHAQVTPRPERPAASPPGASSSDPRGRLGETPWGSSGGWRSNSGGVLRARAGEVPRPHFAATFAGSPAGEGGERLRGVEGRRAGREASVSIFFVRPSAVEPVARGRRARDLRVAEPWMDRIGALDSAKSCGGGPSETGRCAPRSVWGAGSLRRGRPDSGALARLVIGLQQGREWEAGSSAWSCSDPRGESGASPPWPKRTSSMSFPGPALSLLKRWRTPLHYACAYGNPAVVALLVKRKCSIDLCDSDGNTPLMKALQYEEEECAIILLEHGANPNVHNNKGETPLHYVIFYRNTLIAKKLLSSNADIEAKNTSGQTPLLLAIKKNRQMMVEFFIKNKANVHAVDDNGRTALMLAVEHKSTQIAELLLHCGVNVSASDNCGEIALSYAIARGNTANRNLILQYMKGKSRTSVNFNPVKESPKDDSLRRSIKKSHSDDSLFAMVGGSYEAHIKNIPEKGGEFIEASRQSMKDEVKYDTGNQKSGNLPDKSKPSSRKKEILETTLVQAIRIKNDCPSIPSPESKMTLSQILPQNSVCHSFGDAHQREKDGINGHTEAEPLWFSSSEEEEEGLDDTKSKQPQVFSEGGPQMCISHSSGEKHYIAKEKADGHVHASRDSSDFRKCTDPITIKEALPRTGLGKVKEKTVKLAETHFDMTSEEEHKSFDDGQCTQSQVFSEDHPPMFVSHSSGEKHHKAKEKEDGHVHDSVSLSKTQKAVLLLQRIIKSKKSHCTQCSLHVKKNAQLENEIHDLKQRVSEFKQENIEFKQQLHNLRYTLKEDEVKRKK